MGSHTYLLLRSALAWIALWSVAPAKAATGESLRVALVAPDDVKTSAAALASGLGARLGTTVAAQSISSVRPGTDVLVLVHGPGAAADAVAVQQLLESVAGVVLIAGRPEAWPKEFPLVEWLGAKPAGVFASGASLSVINLLGHPILTGIEVL